MSFSNPIVSEIDKKIKTLIQQRDGLKNQVNIITDDLAQTKKELNGKENELAELEQKYKVLKLAKSLEGEKVEGNRDMKLKINEMVREIDKCIALLNK